MSSIIELAVAWAVATANDSSHGYDQNSRWSPDYDCSSFVISAWEHAGVLVKTNGASYTGNMCPVFLKCGFVDVTKQVTLSTGAGLKKGDVLWVNGHTEMMCSDTKIVGATISENGSIYADQTGDQTGQEIRIRDYYSKPWTRVLRYPNIASSDIITGNRYLTQEEMQVNAKYICDYLMGCGWTLNAVCGMLGNMETESTMNPAIWQNLDEGNTSLGYGLVQWTPATNLIDWCQGQGQGLEYSSMDAQLQRILYELENGIQYYQTDEYPLSFSEFSKSTMPVSYLAQAFLYNYERPSNMNQPERSYQAQYWYDYLSAYVPSKEEKKKKKGLSLIMMYLATKR